MPFFPTTRASPGAWELRLRRSRNSVVSIDIQSLAAEVQELPRLEPEIGHGSLDTTLDRSSISGEEPLGARGYKLQEKLIVSLNAFVVPEA